MAIPEPLHTSTRRWGRQRQHKKHSRGRPAETQRRATWNPSPWACHFPGILMKPTQSSQTTCVLREHAHPPVLDWPEISSPHNEKRCPRDNMGCRNSLAAGSSVEGWRQQSFTTADFPLLPQPFRGMNGLPFPLRYFLSGQSRGWQEHKVEAVALSWCARLGLQG